MKLTSLGACWACSSNKSANEIRVFASNFRMRARRGIWRDTVPNMPRTSPTERATEPATMRPASIRVWTPSPCPAGAASAAADVASTLVTCSGCGPLPSAYRIQSATRGHVCDVAVLPTTNPKCPACKVLS